MLAGVEERRGNVSEVWDWLMADGRHGLAVEEAAELFEDVELATVVLERRADGRRSAGALPDNFAVLPDRTRSAARHSRPMTARVIESFGGTVKFSIAACW